MNEALLYGIGAAGLVAAVVIVPSAKILAEYERG
jgi:hypothetical protein